MTVSKNHQNIRLKPFLLLVTFVTNLTLVTSCINKPSFVSIEDKFKNSPKASSFHLVRKGETLFSISLRYGIDYRKLASANSIKSPYHIYPGQRIDIREHSTSTAQANPPHAKKTSKPPKPNRKEKTTSVKQTHSPSNSQKNDAISSWLWPSNGRLIRPFSTKNPINKGIDIAGTLGDSVVAVAAGEVVFAKQGLRGYGNLVIIEHNRKYLSAYAHISRILVEEQEKVKAGQVIAEIGSTGTNEVKLHFEIRDNGKAVNPQHYLPAR